jgi:2-keto-3-deoxy-L-rhamnonate aldolase RhmA
MVEDRARPQRLFSRPSPLVGTWISIGHPTVTEVCAKLDLDFLIVDIEHTAIDLGTVENMARAVDAVSGDTELAVRIPENNLVWVKRVLDIGVTTVMVPMINTEADAEALVDAVRYPPKGTRGVAGGRAADFGMNLANYYERAEESITTIAQIETSEAVTNADQIAAVDGVDGLFVGPADLSASIGKFGQQDSEEYNAAIRHVTSAGTNAGIPVGTLCVDPDTIEKAVKKGFDYIIVGKDTASIARATKEAADKFRRAIKNS